MAKQNTGNVGELSAKEIADIRAEAVALQNTVGSIGTNLQANLSILGNLTKENIKGYQEGFSAAKTLSAALQAVDANTLASKKEQLVFTNKVRKAEEEATRLQAKANRLRAESNTMNMVQKTAANDIARSYEDAAEALRQQAKAAQQITNEFEALNKKVKVFDDLAGFFSEIPGLSRVFGEFQRAADAAASAASKGGNSFVAGAKELTGAFVKGVTAFGISAMVKGLKNIDERSVSLQRNLNKSTTESENIAKNFNRAAKGITGLTGTDLQKAAEGFAETLGTTAVVSTDTAATLATQVQYMGLSVEQASKLNAFSEATGTSLKDDTAQMAGQVILSNARNRTSIKYQAIMKDIAGTSNATKLLITGQGKSLTAAAIEAKKLGTTMEGIANIGKSMLDFESSIANELEAELLTGGEINNERARALALMGDTEGLAKEVAKSGVLAKFEASKNVLQQEALAKAYGMSKEEMAGMVIESKALTSLGAKDKTELSEKVKLRLQEIDGMGTAAERAKATADLTKQLGSDELIQKQEALTLAEKQEKVFTKILEAMDFMSKLLKPLGFLLKLMADHANAIATALLLVTGGSMISKVGKLTNAISGNGGGATAAEGIAGSGGSNLARAAKAFSKGGLGGGMKSLSRMGKAGMKVGLKGAAAGGLIGTLISGIQNVSEHGWTGEALGRTALSGAGTFLGGLGGSALAPGVGTVAGGMAGGMAGDWLGDKIFGEKPEEMQDFILRPGQRPLKFRKDDVVMGGTNLTGNSNGGTGGGNVEALLQELIAAVKQGSNIYLGTNKLNESIGLNLHPMR